MLCFFRIETKTSSFNGITHVTHLPRSSRSVSLPPSLMPSLALYLEHAHAELIHSACVFGQPAYSTRPGIVAEARDGRGCGACTRIEWDSGDITRVMPALSQSQIRSGRTMGIGGKPIYIVTTPTFQNRLISWYRFSSTYCFSSGQSHHLLHPHLPRIQSLKPNHVRLSTLSLISFAVFWSTRRSMRGRLSD